MSESKSTFADVEFMSASKKEAVLRAWVRFVKGGFGSGNFSGALYNHLIQHCGFIAHYSAGGFYATYFERPEDALRFLSQFDRNRGCQSIECGGDWWLRGDYADINNAMVDSIASLLPAIYTKLNGTNLDVAVAELEIAKSKVARLSSAVGR